MKKNTKFVAYLAVFSALTFVTTVSITIPVPATSGYINFGDTIIMIAASILGPIGGMISGGIGSMLADLIYAPYYAPITLIVKGLEGLLTGLIIRSIKRRFSTKKAWYAYAYAAAYTVGAAIMLLGYYLGGGLLLGILNQNDFAVGFAAALSEIPGNCIQGGVSVAVAYALSVALTHIPYVKGLQAEFLGQNAASNPIYVRTQRKRDERD